jgi:AraC-like DNA-binding protein
MTHLSIVSTLMDFADELGTPLESSLAAAKLPTRIVDRRTGYVPCKRFCAWVDREARAEGIDNFGLRSVMQAGVGGLMPIVVDTVSASQSLLEGLWIFVELACRESSHVSIWLEQHPEGLRFCHRGSYPRSVPGQVDMSWWSLGMLIHVVRLFLGPGWCPPTAGVPAQGNGQSTASDLIPGTDFVAEADIVWILVPKRSLAMAPITSRLPGATLSRFGKNALPPEDLLEGLSRSIEMYLQDRALGVQEAAEIAGTSVRSLQRYLSSRQLSYSKLVSNLRFKTAKRQLAHTDQSIAEIASELGYSDPSHFARAFRRIAGVSPTEYRETEM